MARLSTGVDAVLPGASSPVRRWTEAYGRPASRGRAGGPSCAGWGRSSRSTWTGRMRSRSGQTRARRSSSPRARSKPPTPPEASSEDGRRATAGPGPGPAVGARRRASASSAAVTPTGSDIRSSPRATTASRTARVNRSRRSSTRRTALRVVARPARAPMSEGTGRVRSGRALSNAVSSSSERLRNQPVNVGGLRRGASERSADGSGADPSAVGFSVIASTLWPVRRTLFHPVGPPRPPRTPSVRPRSLTDTCWCSTGRRDGRHTPHAPWWSGSGRGAASTVAEIRKEGLKAGWFSATMGP